MKSRFSDDLLQRLERCGVIAVLVLDRLEHAVPLAKALFDGGVSAMELTLRTTVALAGLREIRRHVPEMIAGIGTILRVDQVDAVRAADAAFGVAPGCNPRVVERALAMGLPFAPGVITPTDVEIALEHGCRELKFFPAESSGGLQYLDSMAAPFLHLGTRFIPLGGVHRENLASYLASPLVLAVGGSWLAPRAAIQAEAWQQVTETAREAREMVERVRVRR
jgi:2-dehydro-3-deoxyphosphogluconate aldolase / (4S)-4-hydroxy-2-oxoglutarate aldolase